MNLLEGGRGRGYFGRVQNHYCLGCVVLNHAVNLKEVNMKKLSRAQICLFDVYNDT